MVSFRKLFMVLAAVAMLATVTASAQVSCTVSAEQPAVRFEGLTEPVGTITLNCTSTATLSGTPTANFRVSSPVAITNTISTSNVTDASLTVDAGTAIKTGVLTADGKSIDWSNISIPTSGNFTVKISGVRINANQTGGPFSNVSFSVFGFAATQGGATLGLTSNSVSVATVQKGMNFTAKDAGTTTSCGSAAVPAVDATTFKVSGTPTTITFTPNIPNAIPVGTQLVAKFNVPTGATLSVGGVNLNDGALAATGTTLAVIGTDATADVTKHQKFEAQTATANVATVTWTVVTSTPNGAYTFPVAITYSGQGVAPSSTVTATGNLGPISTVVAASSDSKVPATRFADVTSGTTPVTLFTINGCATTLLFPWVTTSVGGYETGIAITNPTADLLSPAGTYIFSGTKTAAAGQPGTCTLYFQGTGAPSPATVTSASIAAGTTLAFPVSVGSGDIKGATAFSGYIIAQCNFSNATGFAFITDTGATKFGGVGYVATTIATK